MQRYYPTNAPRRGSFTLTGNGSAADVLVFPFPCDVVIQNNTGATIEAAPVSAAGIAASQGDESVPVGSEDRTFTQTQYLAIYGAPGVSVNGTTAGGIVAYGMG